MAHITLLLIFIAALIYGHSCSVSQTTPNNQQNTTNPCPFGAPITSQIIPQRERRDITLYFDMPRYGPVNITDTTGCLELQIVKFQASQSSGYSEGGPYFSAEMSGNAVDRCGSTSYRFVASQNRGLFMPSNAALISSPQQLQYATLFNVTLLGATFAADDTSKDLVIVIASANFNATTKPYSNTQSDTVTMEKGSEKGPQCTQHLVTDEASNIVYSQPFNFRATWDNQLYTFNFPVNLAATERFQSDKSILLNCTCAP